ncbi:MAG: type IV pilin N-terminal domain-containing protein [Halorientalis sp.]
MLPSGSRGTSAVVAVALLSLVTVLAAGAVGTLAVGIAPDGAPPRVVLSASADAGADRVALTHRSGEPLDVSRLRLVVHVGGRRLAHQPPVPFFAARGFESGPTGPFNVATGGAWRVGETATFRLASTNSPQLSPGVRVRVDVYRGRYRLASVTTRAD